MSRFPSEWLALREPVDMASHNQDVLGVCVRTFGDQESLSICDLGAGTGASVRAFAPLLPRRQYWTLVDHDAENLNAAKDILEDWSESAKTIEDRLVLEHAGKHIEVQFAQRDLSADAAPWPAETNLITASALFDLTSESWIARLVKKLASDRLSLLAVLSFDGRIEISPGHARDERMFRSFCAHQQTDKGFGPASGPGAAAALEIALRNTSYTVTSGDSPWRMEFKSQKLMHETLKGIAAAAAETGAVTENESANWLDDRISRAESLIIGHRDIFAKPQT